MMYFETIVIFLKAEMIRQHGSIRGAARALDMNASSIVEFTKNGRDVKLKTFLEYCEKLEIDLGLQGNTQSPTLWLGLNDVNKK